ncbi:etoposide-induced protein 2.4-domain-containing protein [Roridomyces roridus]|uniref:Etoposide-induced protein 2.4-domain-containing protein n=1 Tax=Roridomyces roridus TaxID=1738132 RepID=A0AAD7FMK6_9AGAR|nr:etoposide-induced protein 2.4-domain-containing protein [Roridomyces roridus]
MASGHHPQSHLGGHATSYPLFLSIQESALLQLSYATRGLLDAFRWVLVGGTIAGDAETRANISKSLLLNSFCLVCLYVLDMLFLDKWMQPSLGVLYQLLWVLPVVGTSFYLNGSWCTLIAKRTYRLQGGGGADASQGVTYTGLLTAIATSAYRIVMVFTSVVISFALGFIPTVGPGWGSCFFVGYYCFEFVWIARGWSLSRRVRYLEEHWAYFLAFGFPSAALCTWGSSLANAVVFALIFPLYIIMAMHARPVPDDPYSPQQDNDVIRHPSPYIPIRIPIFGLVMWLNDAIVRIVSVGGGGRGGRRPAHSRALSDAVESLELGGGGEQFKPTRARINIGRRKMD